MDKDAISSEFDKRFLDSLLSVVMDGKWPAQKFRGDDRHIISSKRARAFIYRFNSTVLNWMSYMHRIDLTREVIFHSRAKQKQPIDQLPGREGEGGSQRNRKWSYVYLALYSVCLLAIMTNVYFQYVYDVNKLRLQELNYRLEDQSRTINRLEAVTLQQKFEHDMRKARAWQRTLGAPLYGWTFLVEIMLVFVTKPVVVALFIIPTVYGRSNLNIISPRLFLDRANECRVRVQMIKQELERFALSSLMFSRVRLDEAGKELRTRYADHGDQEISPELTRIFRDKVLAIVAKRIVQLHLQTIGRLKRIALEGRLNQLNRTPAGCDMLALGLFAMISMPMIGILGFCVIFLIFGEHYFRSKGVHSTLESPQDVLNILLMLMTNVTVSLVTTLLASVHALTVGDQVGSIRRLREMIVEAGRLSEHRLNLLSIDANVGRNSLLHHPPSMETTATCHAQLLHSPYNTSLGQNQRKFDVEKENVDSKRKLGELIELDLLTIIIQCRLTIRTFKWASKQMSITTIMVIYYAFFVGFTLRLHSSYYPHELQKACKLIGLLLALSSLGYLIPLCVVHEQMIIAYKSLWSLNAQMSRFESVTLANKSLETQPSVAIMTLRRELADSIKDKFACKILLVPITYGNLFRIIFWVFLVMVPLMDGTVSGGAGLLNDPLNLYSFERGL